MTSNGLPVGQLFSHVYLSGGALLSDKETFRRRLGFYCQNNLGNVNSELINFLQVETGLKIKYNGYFLLAEYFNEIEIKYLLNSITLVWRFLIDRISEIDSRRVFEIQRNERHAVAIAWRDFVVRVFHEEGMGYQLDEKCGVHFFIDKAFEQNRQSIIPALDNSRYAGVLAAFEGAYSALDGEPQDSKQAVRLIFEAVEILAKLMHPKAARLDNQLIEIIRDQAKASYSGDRTACSVADKMFASFVDWMNGLHFYRHGQGEEEHVTPPLDMAIFAISSGTGYLRWLLEIDAKSQQ
jgi:hypothetical protein